ncbi:hypothetical protein TNCV_2509191 [Trichonephila clavipes]|nr:hypothetical protein TNCV_2509191 [Trichonephila clavipes]
MTSCNRGKTSQVQTRVVQKVKLPSINRNCNKEKTSPVRYPVIVPSRRVQPERSKTNNLRNRQQNRERGKGVQKPWKSHLSRRTELLEVLYSDREERI